MCPSCRGLGTELAMDPEKVVPDPTLSIRKGAFEPLRRRMNKAERWNWRVLEAFAQHHEIPLGTPWEELSEAQRRLLLDGATEVEALSVKGRKYRTRIQYEGVLGFLMRSLDEADTEAKRKRFGSYLSSAPCSVCDGGRLRPESRAVLFEGRSLVDLCRLIEDAAAFEGVTLEGRDKLIGQEPDEVCARFSFLLRVGLGYPALERGGPTLSGGEAQRIRLASQLGSQLTGVLYVLDEPSIGLHQRDNERLISTLEDLRDQGTGHRRGARPRHD